jgi:hypothetical protein
MDKDFVGRYTRGGCDEYHRGGNTIGIKNGATIPQIRQVVLKVPRIAIIVVKLIITRKVVSLSKDIMLIEIEVEDTIEEEVEGECIKVIL